ncbi:RidA family protein [Salininema proteolyticum]|uniref:RidA family protein n=1 Tax=Salininema proteolyticum TaxID=1607685 RepID=A0ABV8TYT5_9ACTN
MSLEHINPDSMHTNPAYSQAIKVTGPHATVYVGGQNGVDSDGSLVGDDLAAQAEQAVSNVVACLEEAGARREDTVKLDIHLVEGADVQTAFAGAQKAWGDHPTTVTVVKVAGLGVPGALVEVGAIAAIGAARRPDLG